MASRTIITCDYCGQEISRPEYSHHSRDFCARCLRRAAAAAVEHGHITPVCSAYWDAARLLVILEGVSLSEAVRRLTGDGPRPSRPPAKPPSKPAKQSPAPRQAKPSGLSRNDAEALLEASAARLWGEEGSEALAYLQARGLAAETIKEARLGFVPSAWIPKADGNGFFQASGITIPWIGWGDKIVSLKIWQHDGRRPKYVLAFDDPTMASGIYPSAEAVLVGKPLVVCEGEFDALLLDQKLRGRAGVITLGSPRPSDATKAWMLCAFPWFIATDDDDAAGDLAAEGWPARAIRVRPPQGGKDYTEFPRTNRALQLAPQEP